ncbi:MAG: SiaB family protein kinase [Bacteroidales bacterium]|jgi:hypothetical protein
MASLIQGFEYDIFISYRQKDNKYDGWVTEFVDHLKRELEATFKEEISVYFDINPRDGLLETHSVNRSLENKLKCLIFIPILSRTYCDSKCFAWNNEFLPFLKIAEKDRFGLNIKLINGNVASRVLPVRIHDLELEDIKLIETHLGTIRSVDFIYKSPGVNRHLRAIEEHPQDNLNKTYYRDQINKLANAIDEIIRSLKIVQIITDEERTLLKEVATPDFLQESGTFLSYKGQIDFNTINLLLKKLKKIPIFENLKKTSAKKVYSILSECLDNISKYSLKKPGLSGIAQPSISLGLQNNKIIIKTSNPVSEEKINNLDRKLKQINDLDEETIRALYDERINQESKTEESGAGLGFILMVLKSGNKIEYKFTRANEGYYYFELQIPVNESIGRKLIIDKTIYSPAVTFDPDKNIFEISGESRPFDVPRFYEILLKWLDEYSLHLNNSNTNQEPIIFNFNFEYYNSLSSKYILDFCKKLANLRIDGKNINIKWHYEEDDMDMLEAGKEMSRISKFPFEYIQKGLN